MDGPSIIPFSDQNYITPTGCDVCRRSKVSCDGQNPPYPPNPSHPPHPPCARCVHLDRKCTWPLPRLRLRWRRRGNGSYRSRAGRQALNPILPNNATASTPSAIPTAAVARSFVAVDPSAMMDHFFQPGYDESLDDNAPLETLLNFYFPERSDGVESTSFEILGSFPIPTPPATAQNGNFDFGSFLSNSMPQVQVQSASSVYIGSNEQSALGHYQSTFSIYRTTKTPRWSTHTLLLDLGNSNPMIMRFILAVSINDISQRTDGSPSQNAQTYFELAERALDETIERASTADHITLMVSFLLLYLYIPKGKTFPRERIQKLSRDVFEYVSVHRLDSRCLERSSGDAVGDSFTDADRTLLARLIIWIYDEDVKCSFQGVGGYLAEYLTAHRERTMAVCEVSRTALGAHWGEEYPENEAADDDDNAVELEFLWALTTLWQDINQLAQGSDDYLASTRQVEQRFKLLQRKYSTVFQNSAQTVMPRTRQLVNSDYDVILFNALKVYNFRSTIVDLQMATPDDIRVALLDIYELMDRTFASNKNELHDRLQWPLFLAALEIEDKIYRGWMVDRVSKKSQALILKIAGIQDSFTPRKRMEMSKIRSLLYGNDGEADFGPLVERGYVMDDDVEF